jgi:lipopolysaccharide transport system ATP-binding protein
MTHAAIRVEKLSKLYRIGLREQRKETLAATCFEFLKSPVNSFRKLRAMGSVSEQNADDEDTFWALRDISFEVGEGQAFGIIGANGAGKSTLLRILSGITDPTSGRAEIRGRIASLLEVGTGFHPELTGRENVYLNGTILGMTKAEVNRNFDKIVAFSGVEKFIDTPVKRYSSGMMVRLAFAVAAHLEPEILLIDEVLAVGDAIFQQQCLDRMSELAASGKTLLFVSHNLAAMSRLCDTGMMLANGSVFTIGKMRDVLGAYSTWNQRTVNDLPDSADQAIQVGLPRIHHSGQFLTRSDCFLIEFKVSILESFWHVVVTLGMNTHDGRLIMLSSIDSKNFQALGSPGRYTLRAKIPCLWLSPLSYPLQIKIIASPHLGKTKRYLSPWIHVDIAAEQGLNAHIDALLSPKVEWGVH